VTKLSEAELAGALTELVGWRATIDPTYGEMIERTVRLAAYMDGLRFLLKVGEPAEAMGHHPRIDIRYKNIRFALTTRADGGPSEKDTALAHQINQALENEALE
jgi:4a-hydroxytetrahydrobiopterin dehydratase